MGFTENLLAILENFARAVPVEAFVFVGSLVEEIIAPIPSPFVMTLTGSLVQAQDFGAIYLLWAATLGAIGKTLGAWFLYFVADKAEDVIIPRFGKFFGVSHKDVETIGGKFTGGWKDFTALLVIRSLPIMPSSPVSIVCGLIRLNMKVFILATFIGSIIRNMAYLYIGYGGLDSYKSITSGLDTGETIGKVIFLVLLAAGIFWAYKKRGSSED